MPIFLLGAQLFAGTVFLAGVFVAALLLHNQLSWQLALVSQGFSYLCASAQVMLTMEKIWQSFIVIALWLITLVIGAAAGLLLL